MDYLIWLWVFPPVVVMWIGAWFLGNKLQDIEFHKKWWGFPLYMTCCLLMFGLIVLSVSRIILYYN